MTVPEVWLRGPIDGVSPLLQPVAHSLLQSRQELTRAMSDLTALRQLRETPTARIVTGARGVRRAGGAE
jgi:hypothetical protein